MINYLKIILVVLIGLILGLIIHGVIEILAILVLTVWLSNLFLSISWAVWIWIHSVFTIIVEILGIVLVLRIYKKHNK